MATSRKRYFRVADSILREPWDRDTKLTLVLLMAHLNTRWARDGIADEEAGNAVLSSADLLSITGRSRRDHGLNALVKLGDKVSLTVESAGDYVLIKWPKFPEFQEYASRSRGSRNANESPLQSESESDTNPKKERGRGKAPSAPPAPRAPRARRHSAKTACPDHLEPEQRDSVRAWATAEGIDPNRLRSEWEAMRDHWRSRSEMRADWPATFRTWLRRSMRYDARDQAQVERESPAQARERRTKEAALEAFRRMSEGDDAPPLLALPGGRS